MDRWGGQSGRVALVTGASVGIGASAAEELVRSGMTVVGCARDVEKMQKLAVELQAAGHSGVQVPFQCDLNSEEEILSMFAAIKEQHRGVDVCINNAGLAHPESLLNGKTSGWKKMLDVNVLALCICTREVYQSMKERNVDDGHIININRDLPGRLLLSFQAGGKRAGGPPSTTTRHLSDANEQPLTQCTTVVHKRWPNTWLAVS
ncbi:dehydrogenase/reductase SDR family member 11-like isoform X1 [Gasterosteus aculeatus]